MKDADARMDIDYLKRRVETLQSEVNELRRNLDERTHLESEFGYFGRCYYFPVAEVVKLILDHLGLEARHRAPMASTIELSGTRKESDVGSVK